MLKCKRVTKQELLSLQAPSSSGTLNNSGFRIDGSTVTEILADNDNPTPGGETPGPGNPAGYDVLVLHSYKYNFDVIELLPLRTRRLIS